MVLSRRQPGGFTLLELLVAMVLMVVTASCLYTALYTGFRAHRSAVVAIEPTSQALNAIELLKQDIYGVLPPGEGLAGAFIGTDASGIKGADADSLLFHTTHTYASEEQVVGGLSRIELLLEEDAESDNDTHLLLRRVTTNLLAPKEAEADEQVLCRNVVGLNLRYFAGGGWVDGWDSTEDANSLPLAIELDVRIAHNGRDTENEQAQRRLIQSFVIPCRTAASEEQESEAAR